MDQELQQLLEAQRQHATGMISSPINYFDRNRKWLIPLAAMFFVLVAGLSMSMLAEPDGKPPLAIPPIVYGAVLIIGTFSTGFGAKMTDTVSAKVVEYLGLSAAVGIIVYSLLK